MKPSHIFKREELKRFRKAFGYSQEEFAARLGMDSKAVSEWERGKKNPLPQTVEKMCKVLGVQQSELLEVA